MSGFRIWSSSIVLVCLPISTFGQSDSPNPPHLQPPSNSHSAAKRLVNSRPKTGRFVSTPNGFMVPYSSTIPGTQIAFEMVPVPGNPKKNIAPFWIGRHEVTAAEYTEFMKLYMLFRAIEVQRPKQLRNQLDLHDVDAVTAPTPVYEPAFHFEYTTGPQSPAVSMSRFAARQYTKWLSLITSQQFRLPTEKEWEHACGCEKPTTWSFGNNVSQTEFFAVCTIGEQTPDGPATVGSRRPNAWGIHDMHGNVSEWVLSASELRDHRKIKLQPEQKWGPDAYAKQFEKMILKGGYWEQTPYECKTTARKKGSIEFWEYDPDLPHSPCWLAGEECRGIGFRIISPLTTQPREEIEKYWGPDTAHLVQDVEDRMADGRGQLGRVSPQLPDLMRQLLREKKLRPERPPWTTSDKRP